MHTNGRHDFRDSSLVDTDVVKDEEDDETLAVEIKPDEDLTSELREKMRRDLHLTTIPPSVASSGTESDTKG